MTQLTAEQPTVHLEYVDNFASLGIDRAEVMPKKQVVLELMLQSGFGMQEEGDGLLTTEHLGWFLDGCRGLVTPTLSPGHRSRREGENHDRWQLGRV